MIVDWFCQSTIMRFATKIPFLLAALFAAHSVALAAPEEAAFALHDGDRVVFFGDSITDQRLYTIITETAVVTRYPKLNASFIHSGWGGDKVSGGGGGPIDLRLDRDVLAYKPTVMTIMLGMNDGLYRPESPETDKIFFDGYRHIVDKVKAGAPGIRITAIQPSPYDDTTRDPLFPGGYNEVLISFSKWIENYAHQADLNVANFNTAEVAMLHKATTLAPDEAQKIIPDRVHPSFAGHLIMAEQLLRAWNVRPLVSAVEVEAGGGKPTAGNLQHAALADLSATNGGLSWSETEDGLPLPLAEWQKNRGYGPLDLVLRSSDFAQAMNNEQLRVTGLKNGVYALKIDGANIASFNNDELAHGVNLGVLDTPMTKQSKEVFDLTVSHGDIHNERWRTVQVPLSAHNLQQAEAAMSADDALEQAVLTKRQQAAQPRPHRFELVPVS